MSRLDQTVLQSELEMAKPTTVDENQQTKAALRRAMAAMLLLTIKDDDTRVWLVDLAKIDGFNLSFDRDSTRSRAPDPSHENGIPTPR